jgi:hypothetical protein
MTVNRLFSIGIALFFVLQSRLAFAEDAIPDSLAPLLTQITQAFINKVTAISTQSFLRFDSLSLTMKVPLDKNYCSTKSQSIWIKSEKLNDQTSIDEVFLKNCDNNLNSIKITRRGQNLSPLNLEGFLKGQWGYSAQLNYWKLEVSWQNLSIESSLETNGRRLEILYQSSPGTSLTYLGFSAQDQTIQNSNQIEIQNLYTIQFLPGKTAILFSRLSRKESDDFFTTHLFFEDNVAVSRTTFSNDYSNYVRQYLMVFVLDTFTKLPLTTF